MSVPSRPGAPLIVDRSRLPQPAPSDAFAFPAIDRTTLANGLRVWTVRHAAVPVVSATLLIRQGAAADPARLHGLAALTADMLDEGSGGRSAIQMHEALQRLGAHFDTDIGADALALSVSGLSRFTGEALGLVADMVVRPTLADADFQRVRQLRLHRLVQLRDIPAAVAERTFFRLLYGDAPYGHTPIGSEQALAAASLDDVRRFHARSIVPDGTTLIVVGDCEHASIVRHAEDAFGTWTGSLDREADRDATLPTPARLSIVPRKGAPQSELRIGHVAESRATPDYHALLAANLVLGGQFVSRLNMNLREEKGFTYGVRTGFEFRRRPGPFAMQVSVHTAATVPAIEESLREMTEIRSTRPITPEELEVGVAALTRGYAKNFETADQVARAIMQIALYDLPDTYFAEFVGRIQAITAEEATRVLERHLHPDRLVTLIVGDLEAIAADLPRLGLGEPIVLSAETF